MQNAWLVANGKISERGKGISRSNPSIALKENPMYSYITGRQKAKKMDIKHLKGVSWRKNVLDNVQILKEANVPREKILELLKQTRKFAKKNNL